MPKKRVQLQRVVLLLVDAAMIFAAFVLSYFFRFEDFSRIIFVSPVKLAFLWASFLVSFYIFNLYELTLRFKSSKFLARLFAAVLFAAVFNIIISYALPYWMVGRGLTLLNAVLIFFLMFLWRVAFEKFAMDKVRRKAVIILGAGGAGRYISDVIRKDRNYTILGFLDDDPKVYGGSVDGFPVLGDSAMIPALLDHGKVDEIVVAITHEKRRELLRQLLCAKLAGVEIYDVPTVYEDLTGKLPVSHLRDGWIVYTSFKAMSRSIYIHVKRLGDISLAITGLMLSAPVMFLTALVIKMDSPGPVLFRQQRVGLDGKVFTIFKFRSMRQDSEKGGAVFAQVNDSRVTRVGSILRKSRIDEIPQLWNILMGNMSFVGPRPERPEFVENFEKKIPYYALRHIVKPGLTGWAQVNYRYGASEEDALEKLQYDMYYLKNLSLLLDIQTALKTINVVLFRELGR